MQEASFEKQRNSDFRHISDYLQPWIETASTQELRAHQLTLDGFEDNLPPAIDLPPAEKYTPPPSPGPRQLTLRIFGLID